MGWMIPWDLMDAASSCSDSWRMSTRGWYLPRCRRSSGRLASSSPGSLLTAGAGAGSPGAGGAVAGSGRRDIWPSSASRPRPMTGFFWLMGWMIKAIGSVERTLGVGAGRRFLRRTHLGLVGRVVILAEHFAGQRQVGKRPARVLVVLQGRLA